jgi:hypothetical protein
VATAASSLKHGTSTAIRIDDGIIAETVPILQSRRL